MSIYASLPDIGLDETMGSTGEVLAYLGSHVFPAPHHTDAAIFLANIPGHCVPGQDDDDFEHVAEYLRLDVMTDTNAFIDASVVLTVAGATRLRDQLTQWLQHPKRAVDGTTTPG